MPFVQRVVPTFHWNVTRGTQGKVIYCSMKTWPNQQVKYITEDNSCFRNGRSWWQKLWCVCRLQSKAGEQTANGGSSGQQQIKPTRTCLAFAAIPLTTFPAGVMNCDLTPYLYYLYIQSLPQPPKTLAYPQTLSHLHWAPQKTKSLCP